MSRILSQIIKIKKTIIININFFFWEKTHSKWQKAEARSSQSNKHKPPINE